MVPYHPRIAQASTTLCANGMNRKYTKLIVTLIAALLNTASYLYAQPENSQLLMKAQVAKSEVLLRWAPSSYEEWQLGNKYGYKLEKILVSVDGKVVEHAEYAVLGHFKPLAEEAWEPLVKKDTIWAPIALQCLWGETFELTSSFQGNVMEAYSKVKENESRFGFALFSADRSLVVADGLGLLYRDPIANRNEQYIYRAYIDIPNGDGSNASYVIVNQFKPTEYLNPEKPSIERNGASILLSWNVARNDFVGFHVERSLNGKRFHQVSTDLVVPFSDGGNYTAYFADSLQAGVTRYTYRVVGITPFETRGSYSDTTTVIALSEVVAPRSITSSINLKGEVEISWTYDAQEPPISHFKITRARSPLDTYEVIAQKVGVKQRRWVDRKPLNNGYYKVTAISRDGAEGVSLDTYASLSDDTPPEPPTGAHGVVDSLGVVSLSWNPSAEVDILGYRVFRANNMQGSYMQVTPEIISYPSYKDTIQIHTLTKKVYYKLVALDKRYNASNFSEILVLQRPDIVPPEPPILKTVEQANQGIVLRWIPSPSIDVRSYLIYRCSSRDTALVALAGSAKDTYVDTTSALAGSHSYHMVAIDSSNNHSTIGNSIHIELRHHLKAENVMLTGAIMDEGGRSMVLLKWNGINEGTCYIYKKRDGGFVLINTLPSTIKEYKEPLDLLNSSEYFIRVLNNSGRGSVSNILKMN